MLISDCDRMENVVRECFQICHPVQGHENLGLFGKELNLSQTSPGFYKSTVQVF